MDTGLVITGQTYICLLMMQKYVDILHVQTIIGSCRKQWITLVRRMVVKVKCRQM